MIFRDKEPFPCGSKLIAKRTLTEIRIILALTTGDLKRLLAEQFGEEKVTYSGRKIARAWSKLGWTFTSATFYQAIRNAKNEKSVVVEQVFAK